MDKVKRGYKNAKGKVKDLLRSPPRQSAFTSPARSPRSIQNLPPTHRKGVSITPSVIALASQTTIAPAALDTPGADDPALEAPAPEPLLQLEHTPDAASTFAQPLSVTSTRETKKSVCDDLLTVVRGASDAFPPLKSALVKILEFWKQCKVRIVMIQNVFVLSNCSFRRLPRLKMSSESSRASSRRS